MTQHIKIAMISFGFPLLFLVAFFFWYQGTGQPLKPSEIEIIIKQIQAQKHNPGGRHNLASLRNFLEADDGKPFYTVNLYKYRDKAKYLKDQSRQVTGREAYDRFSKVMIRLLAQQSSHPIFGSDWLEKNTTGWDRLVIVRYRSRRDIAKIFTQQEFAEACAHKWAGIESNERLLVQGLHIPGLIFPITILTLLLGLVAFYVTTTLRNKSSPISPTSQN